MRTCFGVSRTIERLRLLVALGLGLGLAGCGAVEPVATYEPITDPTQLFMSLRLDPSGAVNMSTAAPYDTLQLTATPRNALGESLSGLPAPVFYLLNDVDSMLVTVTPTGLLTARDETPSSGVKVIAELRTGDNVRRSDTVVVKVTVNPTPPVLKRLSIHPVPPDSAVWSMTPSLTFGTVFLFFAGISPYLFNPTLTPQILDATDTPIDGLAVEYATLDSAVATVDRRSGDVEPIRPGQVHLVARTTAYGITKADTATYTVTWPVFQAVYIQKGTDGAPFFRVSNPFFGSSGHQTESVVTVTPGGFVFWLNYLSDTVDITFDDPTNVADGPASLCDSGGAMSIFLSQDPGPYCGAGNILIPGRTAPGTGDFENFGRIRQFHVLGVYPYHSTRLGISGQVVVRNDLGAP